MAVEALKDGQDGDLLIVGDGNQGLYRNRSFTWNEVGVQAAGRTLHRNLDLDKCYRSTREIMELASRFAHADAAQNAEDGVAAMAIDPSCSQRHGPNPMVLHCDSREDEIERTIQVARELMNGSFHGQPVDPPLEPQEIGILYARAQKNEKSLLPDLVKRLGSLGIPAIWLNENGQARNRAGEAEAKILTIHSSKGLQFRAVILIWADQLPSGFADSDPRIESRQFLVALTRAEEFLTVLHSGRSDFVERVRAATNP